jgi:hypothetical protein
MRIHLRARTHALFSLPSIPPSISSSPAPPKTSSSSPSLPNHPEQPTDLCDTLQHRRHRRPCLIQSCQSSSHLLHATLHLAAPLLDIIIDRFGRVFAMFGGVCAGRTDEATALMTPETEHLTTMPCAGSERRLLMSIDRSGLMILVEGLGVPLGPTKVGKTKPKRVLCRHAAAVPLPPRGPRAESMPPSPPSAAFLSHPSFPLTSHPGIH